MCQGSAHADFGHNPVTCSGLRETRLCSGQRTVEMSRSHVLAVPRANHSHVLIRHRRPEQFVDITFNYCCLVSHSHADHIAGTGQYPESCFSSSQIVQRSSHLFNKSVSRKLLRFSPRRPTAWSPRKPLTSCDWPVCAPTSLLELHRSTCIRLKYVNRCQSSKSTNR